MKGIAMVYYSEGELAHRWGVSVRTVKREVKRFGLIPVHFIKRSARFRDDDVKALEQQRYQHRLESQGYTKSTNVITVRQAKRLAGRCK